MRLFNLKKLIKPKSDEKTYIENERFDSDFEDEGEEYIDIQEGGIYEELEENKPNQNTSKKLSLDDIINEARNETINNSKKVNDDFNLLDR